MVRWKSRVRVSSSAPASSQTTLSLRRLFFYKKVISHPLRCSSLFREKLHSFSRVVWIFFCIGYRFYGVPICSPVSLLLLIREKLHSFSRVIWVFLLGIYISAVFTFCNPINHVNSLLPPSSSLPRKSPLQKPPPFLPTLTRNIPTKNH